MNSAKSSKNTNISPTRWGWLIVILVLLVGVVIAIIVYVLIKSKTFQNLCVYSINEGDNFQYPCCLKDKQYNGLRIDPKNNYLLASAALYPLRDVCLEDQTCLQQIADPCDSSRVRAITNINSTDWYPIGKFPSTLCPEVSTRCEE